MTSWLWCVEPPKFMTASSNELIFAARTSNSQLEDGSANLPAVANISHHINIRDTNMMASLLKGICKRFDCKIVIAPNADDCEIVFSNSDPIKAPAMTVKGIRAYYLLDTLSDIYNQELNS